MSLEQRHQAIITALVKNLKQAQERNKLLVHILTEPHLKQLETLVENKKLNEENKRLITEIDQQKVELLENKTKLVDVQRRLEDITLSQQSQQKQILQQAQVREQEYTENKTALENLKWGFEKRESELLGQVQHYKNTSVSLFNNSLLHEQSTKSLAEDLCEKLVAIERLSFPPLPPFILPTYTAMSTTLATPNSPTNNTGVTHSTTPNATSVALLLQKEQEYEQAVEMTSTYKEQLLGAETELSQLKDENINLLQLVSDLETALDKSREQNTQLLQQQQQAKKQQQKEAIVAAAAEEGKRTYSSMQDELEAALEYAGEMQRKYDHMMHEYYAMEEEVRQLRTAVSR